MASLMALGSTIPSIPAKKLTKRAAEIFEKLLTNNPYRNHGALEVGYESEKQNHMDYLS